MIITYPFIHQLFAYVNVTHHISNRTIIYPSFLSYINPHSHIHLIHQCSLHTYSTHLTHNHTSIILLLYINVYCGFSLSHQLFDFLARGQEGMFKNQKGSTESSLRTPAGRWLGPSSLAVGVASLSLNDQVHPSRSVGTN